MLISLLKLILQNPLTLVVSRRLCKFSLGSTPSHAMNVIFPISIPAHEPKKIILHLLVALAKPVDEIAIKQRPSVGRRIGVESADDRHGHADLVSAVPVAAARPSADYARHAHHFRFPAVSVYSERWKMTKYDTISGVMHSPFHRSSPVSPPVNIL